MLDNSRIFLIIRENSENKIEMEILIKEHFPNSIIQISDYSSYLTNLVSNGKPNIIILDNTMNIADGYEVCRILKAKYGNTPIILINKFNDDRENRYKALGCGADSIFHEPFDEVEMIVELNTLLKVRDNDNKDRSNVKMYENDFIDATNLKGVKQKVRIDKEYLEDLIMARTKELEDEIESRRCLENALIESECKYRSLADSSMCIILERDNNGNILYLNKYGIEFLGYPKEEILGRSAIDKIVDFTDLEVGDFEKRVKKILKNPQEGYSSENEHIKKNGEKVWIEWSNKCIFDDKGDLIKLISVGIDRTKQHKLEKKLIEYQSRLEQMVEERTNQLKDVNRQLKLNDINFRKIMAQNMRIMENLQDAYFQIDKSGTITLANPRSIMMFGYETADEIIGKPAKILYAEPIDRDIAIKELKGKGILSDYVCRGLRKDGTIFWISINSQFIKNGKGSIIGTEALVRDISERKAFEQEIAEQRDSLKLNNEKLGERLRQSVNAISKIGELRDAYTAGHQNRVQLLACEIGRQLNLPDETIVNIYYGALIHDIGKIYIGADILNTPRKLTMLEYQIIQTHAEHGYNIVKEIDFPNEIPTMIYQHHERLDGSGYPQGLKKDQIILESKILAVADVVEAMSSHRPYRPALGIDAALEELELHRCSLYDIDVVDACIHLFRTKDFQFID